MKEFDSYELVARFQEGQSEAAAAIFDRYVARLVALARQRLSSKTRRRIDPEDVVQSAYRSFFLHAENDEYALAQSGDLWRLLAQITLNKLYGQVERHRAARRSVEREDAIGKLLEDATAAPEPTPVEIVALVEQLHLVVGRLSEQGRAVLTAHLQGRTIEEIGEQLGKSPRTIRRILADVRSEVEHLVAGDDALPHDHLNQWVGATIPCKSLLRYGDFVIEQILGAGGIGKVYRARERSTGKKVAIKSLRKLHQGDRRAVEQFAQEAEILAKLSHPNIVGVYGLGRFPGGGFFIVMDLIEGSNLQERLRGGPLELRQALAIVRDVADAIAHAHDHGIVHCDLKPGNVLVDQAGRPVVSDFGFARFLARDAASRRTTIGGTAGFMAPEVHRRG